MSVESELKLSYIDQTTQTIQWISREDLTDQLDKLKKALEYILGKMQKLGDYELSEFTAKAGVELGVWIFKTDGAIEMKWKKPPKKPPY